MALLGALVVAAIPADRETGFLNRVVRVGSERYRYQVYVPANWTPRRKWPVVLFLHGAGERGRDGLLQTEVGLGSAIRRNANRFPCVVVFPQCREGVWWSDPDMEAQAMRALEQSIREFNGDRSRIYLTGLSMGGYAVWRFAAKYPGKFAALVPICGGIRPPAGIHVPGLDQPDNPYESVARQVGRTPVWIFHGSEDPVVPVSESRRMVAALKSLGGDVRYTEYEGVGHNSWDRAYSEPELMPWMLSKRLK